MAPLRPRLRAEHPADAAAIDAVVRAAFAPLARSSHTEHHIVRALRAANALAVSQVAELDGALVGHAAASPITIGDGTAHWFGLGPVAVAAAWQQRGIGAALVQATLRELRARGAAGCVVFGHADYYPRFGFARDPALVLPGLPQDHFFALRWRGPAPAGDVAYHAAFAATD